MPTHGIFRAFVKYSENKGASWVALVVRNPPANVRDTVLIPVPERSYMSQGN